MIKYLFIFFTFVNLILQGLLVYAGNADERLTLKSRPVPQRLKNFKNLSSELKTGLADWSTHPKLHLLPKISDCGFSANFAKNISNSTDTSKNSTSARQARLVGGSFPTLGTFPWASRIDIVDGDTGNITLRCGASLISTRYVLTSARCMTSIPASQTIKHVAFGTSDRRVTTQCAGVNETNCVNTTMIEIDDVIIHQDFVKTSAWNDIALIRLAEDVKFTQFVRPICLPESEKMLENWPNNRLTTYGWGRQESDDEVEPYYYSWNLQSLNISLTPREQCNRVYRRLTGKLDNSRFCGGGEAEKGTCKADIGGPIMKKLAVTDQDAEVSRYYQVGLISFGRCALEGIPTIFVNVLYYMPWILSHIEP